VPETNHCRREGGRKDAAPDPIHEIVSLRCSPDADLKSRSRRISRRMTHIDHAIAKSVQKRSRSSRLRIVLLGVVIIELGAGLRAAIRRLQSKLYQVK